MVETDGPFAESIDAASSLEGLRLPRGAVLLHIGPHKTGTTTIQHAFHVTRSALAKHGVRYAGTRRHSAEAAQSVRGLGPKRRHRDGLQQWRQIVDESRAVPDARVVISSEWLAEATPEAIPQIVGDLGPERTHVVLTLRPLASILPSQWQQYVQGGLTLSYDAWLASVMDPGAGEGPLSFWRRHRHDALVARWTTVVGGDRVTVVMADEQDPRFVLDAFETLLDLPPGTLPLLGNRSNRSLTWPETEVVRQINQVLERAAVDPALRQDLVLFGVAPALRERTPASDEPRISTPPWALEQAARTGREMATAIGRSGVRIIGDLERLGEMRTGGAGREEAPVDGSLPEIAAAALGGAMSRLGLMGPPRSAEPATEPLAPIETRQLAGILTGRLRRALGRRARQYSPRAALRRTG